MILTEINRVCSDPALARSLSFLHQIFEIICIIVPILLIVFVVISLVKMIVNPDLKNGNQKLMNKVMAALLIFFVPSFLDVIMHWVEDTATDDSQSKFFSVVTCWNNADIATESIEDAIYKEGAGTEKGSGLLSLFGDLSLLHQYKGSSSGVAGEGAQRLINVALAELGNHESDGSHSKYESFSGLSNSQPWCAAFVTWCAGQAGFLDSGIIPRYVGCWTGVSWFQSRNQFHLASSGYTPQPGDLVFYGPGGSSHTGIVVSADENNIYTIEGNTSCKGEAESECGGSDGVSKKTRPRTSYIYGYGTPAY